MGLMIQGYQLYRFSDPEYVNLLKEANFDDKYFKLYLEHKTAVIGSAIFNATLFIILLYSLGNNKKTIFHITAVITLILSLYLLIALHIKKPHVSILAFGILNLVLLFIAILGLKKK